MLTHVYLANVLLRTMFLDRDWFTLETASTLIANHSGLLHAPLPVQAPAAAAETAEPAQQQQLQQQQGKKKQAKQPKQQEQSPPQPPPVPLSAIETAAAALSSTVLMHSFAFIIGAPVFPRQILPNSAARFVKFCVAIIPKYLHSVTSSRCCIN